MSHTVVMIINEWEILTALGAVYVAIDDVAHSGPHRKPRSQNHHLPRAQADLMTFLNRVHDAHAASRMLNLKTQITGVSFHL